MAGRTAASPSGLPANQAAPSAAQQTASGVSMRQRSKAPEQPLQEELERPNERRARSASPPKAVLVRRRQHAGAPASTPAAAGKEPLAAAGPEAQAAGVAAGRSASADAALDADAAAEARKEARRRRFSIYVPPGDGKCTPRRIAFVGRRHTHGCSPLPSLRLACLKFPATSQCAVAARAYSLALFRHWGQGVGRMVLQTIACHASDASGDAEGGARRYMSRHLLLPERREWKAAGVLIYNFAPDGRLRLLLGSGWRAPRSGRVYNRDFWTILGAYRLFL